MDQKIRVCGIDSIPLSNLSLSIQSVDLKLLLNPSKHLKNILVTITMQIMQSQDFQQNGEIVLRKLRFLSHSDRRKKEKIFAKFCVNMRIICFFRKVLHFFANKINIKDNFRWKPFAELTTRSIGIFSILFSSTIYKFV